MALCRELTGAGAEAKSFCPCQKRRGKPCAYLSVFRYHDSSTGAPDEKMYDWPGVPEEKIMVVVHQSMGHQELFHRHDFFYFNYTY